jgi:uncharacterized protein
VSDSSRVVIGQVVSLWRYPVKSMMGEELNASEVTNRGLLGDRAYALVDSSDGKVASAKNPRKWPRLFDFRAAFVEPPRSSEELPPVRLTLPDGTIVSSTQNDLDQTLSRVLNREVTLAAAEHGPQNESKPRLLAEGYQPDMEELDFRDTVTDFFLSDGTFFDSAVFHLLTTATLDRFRALYPEGRFEIRRFRPNVVVETINGAKDFVENDWIGRTLAIGTDVRLNITGPCTRCVMTTLPPGDLPKDVGILRAAARHNRTHVGVYASMVQGGTIRRGDSIRLE